MAATLFMNELDAENPWPNRLSEFISCASHELRTPLTIILGFSELLLTDKEIESSKKDEFLSEIYNQGVHLSKIFDDLLLLDKYKSGEKIPLNIGFAVIDDMVSEALVETDEILKGFDVGVQLVGGKTPLLLDRVKFKNALKCIISNAVKFSDKSRRIQISGRKAVFYYMLSIKDEGIGMSPEQLSRVFEPFYRADATNTAKGGLGLGLPMAKAIVKAHQGEIWMASTPGVGTKVTLCLPCEEPSAKL